MARVRLPLNHYPICPRRKNKHAIFSLTQLHFWRTASCPQKEELWIKAKKHLQLNMKVVKEGIQTWLLFCFVNEFSKSTPPSCGGSVHSCDAFPSLHSLLLLWWPLWLMLTMFYLCILTATSTHRRRFAFSWNASYEVGFCFGWSTLCIRQWRYRWKMC